MLRVQFTQVRLTCENAVNLPLNHYGKVAPPSRTVAKCRFTLYALRYGMIKSFRHKGLEAFYHRGTKAGIQAQHAAKLRLQLTALDMKGFYRISVNANWRMIFRFDGKDAKLVDYLDYH